MKRIIRDRSASVDPVIIFFVVLAVASFLILLLGMIVEPFFNLMGSEDDTIKDSILAPRRTMFELGQLIWPKGVLLAVLFGSIFGLLMEFQKSKYQQG